MRDRTLADSQSDDNRQNGSHGIGNGIASFISPMYIAELVPARVRGSLVAVNMLAITTGIVIAYLVDYAFSATHGWRYMFGPAALPPSAW